MPTSDLDIQFAAAPIFQVYRTKRKADTNTDTQIKDNEAKRRCSWQNAPLPSVESQSNPLIYNNNNNDLTPPMDAHELNHNSVAMQDQQHLYERQQQQLMHPALTSVISQQPPRVPSPWPESYQHVDMEMDANDSIEMEMTSRVEAEPHHSSNNATSSSPTNEFCKSYCGRGETSPNSGRVRCFCKPSWEGMLDMKPYISDVY